MPALSQRDDHVIRRTLIIVLGCSVLAYIFITWHWPLIWDMQVMHYVSFLIDRGWAPYRQIGDMNMPGAYIVEHLALSIFGSSDLGWRLYDFTLAATLTAAMISIARRYHWFAGLLAGIVFTFAHAAEGPRNAGQRDQVIAVLLIVAYAFLFEAMRRRTPWLMFFFALAAAMAATIKPFVGPLGPLLMIMAAWKLHSEGIRIRSYIAWSVAGFATSAAIILTFLRSHGATHAFISLLTKVLPHYATILAPSWGMMLASILQPPLALFLILALFATLAARVARQNWEQIALLTGATFGLLSFFAQRKGFDQHRYTFVAFILLWAFIQIFRALPTTGQGRTFAITGIAFILCLYIPWTIWWMTRWPQHDDYSHLLETDLKQIGTDKLQHQVVCLDIIDGCMTALYHLKIEQTIGSTGDLLLFQREQAPAVEAARQGFWQAIQITPPDVYILCNDGFGEIYNFNKLNTWPLFATYLRSNYSILVQQREFYPFKTPTSNLGSNPSWPSYRIYLRRDSMLAHSWPGPKMEHHPDI